MVGLDDGLDGGPWLLGASSPLPGDPVPTSITGIVSAISCDTYELVTAGSATPQVISGAHWVEISTGSGSFRVPRASAPVGLVEGATVQVEVRW